MHGSWTGWVRPTEKYRLHKSIRDFHNAATQGCHFCNIAWASLILRPQIVQEDSTIPICMQIDLNPSDDSRADLLLELSFDGPAPIGRVCETVEDKVARDVMVHGWRTQLTRGKSK